MCKDLDAELANGKAAAAALVDHLARMGAAKASIPVLHAGVTVVVTVERPSTVFERLTEDVVLIDGKHYRLMSDAECADFIWIPKAITDR